MSKRDFDLLAAYREQGDEDAFADLVRRHVGLVYSAALRQVRSRSLAEDVTQLTFLKLARQSRKLAPNTVFTAWLYRTARNNAIDVIRSEARRQKRDQVSLETSAMNSNSSEWDSIEPILDEAMQTLNEEQRTVLLLRFFDNKSLREVGLATGITEDAAQKRVTRATEILKIFFERRGFRVSASGLVTMISANAVQTAPVGLVPLILSAAHSAFEIHASAAGAKLIMTTLQKSILTVSLTLALGTCIYEAHRASRLKDRVLVLEQETEPMKQQITELQAKLSLALRQSAEIPAPRVDNSAAQSSGLSPKTQEEALNLRNRINQLLNATNWPALTPAQVESYLTQNGRKAASLLAIFRANGDTNVLNEALQKYPDDPQVNFAAIFRENMSAEERRRQLDAFAKADPKNALANYLSALDYLKTGQNTEAIKELSSGLVKTEFKDYSMSFRQNAEEAYRAAGYSEAEAKVIASHSLLMPHLVELNRFGPEMVALAERYRLAGDEASARNALNLGISVGQRIEGSSEDPSLTTQLLGAQIERQSLKAIDANAVVDQAGQTASERLAELNRQRTASQDLARQFEEAQSQMSAEDWISYLDRVKSFGEASAMLWIVRRSITN